VLRQEGPLPAIEQEQGGTQERHIQDHVGRLVGLHVARIPLGHKLLPGLPGIPGLLVHEFQERTVRLLLGDQHGQVDRRVMVEEEVERQARQVQGDGPDVALPPAVQEVHGEPAGMEEQVQQGPGQFTVQLQRLRHHRARDMAQAHLVRADPPLAACLARLPGGRRPAVGTSVGCQHLGVMRLHGYSCDQLGA